MSQEPGYGHGPPAYPPQWHGDPAMGHAPERTNTMAVLSLVFAVVSPFVGLVLFPLGIIFGHIARGQIRRTGEGGSGLAKAGLIISYIQLALAVIGIVVLIFVLVLVVGVAA